MDEYITNVKQAELAALMKHWLPKYLCTEPAGAGALQVKIVDSELVAKVQELRQEFGQETVTELVELFVPDAITRLVVLDTAIQAYDAQGIIRTAHSIKGSCSNFGLTQMVALCVQLEQEGKLGMFAEARARLRELEEEFNRVRLLLEAEAALG